MDRQTHTQRRTHRHTQAHRETEICTRTDRHRKTGRHIGSLWVGVLRTPFCSRSRECTPSAGPLLPGPPQPPPTLSPAGVPLGRLATAQRDSRPQALSALNLALRLCLSARARPPECSSAPCAETLLPGPPPQSRPEALLPLRAPVDGTPGLAFPVSHCKHSVKNPQSPCFRPRGGPPCHPLNPCFSVLLAAWCQGWRGPRRQCGWGTHIGGVRGGSPGPLGLHVCPCGSVLSPRGCGQGRGRGGWP